MFSTIHWRKATITLLERQAWTPQNCSSFSPPLRKENLLATKFLEGVKVNNFICGGAIKNLNNNPFLPPFHAVESTLPGTGCHGDKAGSWFLLSPPLLEGQHPSTDWSLVPAGFLVRVEGL